VDKLFLIQAEYLFPLSPASVYIATSLEAIDVADTQRCMNKLKVLTFKTVLTFSLLQATNILCRKQKNVSKIKVVKFKSIEKLDK
jgi:hypothetical protein